MAKKRRAPKGGKKSASAASSTVSMAIDPSGAWILRHPRCARDRAEDMEEVRLMIDAGELEVAQDELRWLLSGCSDSMDAHLLMGELALAGDTDYQLARGHYGYAYQLGLRAWRRAGEPSPVPYAQLANRPFFEAGRALAWCLEKLGKATMADEVVAVMLRLDPADPLECRQMLIDLRNDDSLPLL